MLLVRFYVNVYYVIVCAWAFFYLFSGFTSTANIPWADCGAMELNTIGCYSPREIERCNVCHDGLFVMNVQFLFTGQQNYPLHLLQQHLHEL